MKTAAERDDLTSANGVRVARGIAIALVLLGVLRIVTTYNVFSETFDEGIHVAAGMELLDRGTFTLEPKHPPLSVVAVALGPFASGIRSQGHGNKWTEGRAILHAIPDKLDRTLALARLGMLPFFLLACWAVWSWTRSLAGEPEAAMAVTLFTLSPPILAHAGLATADMALTGTLVTLTWVASRWLDGPTPWRSVALGAAGAAALTAKITSVPYFGLTALLALGAHGWWERRHRRPVVSRDELRGLLIAGAVGFLTVWTIYGFQHGTLRGVPFPLTTLIQGVRDARAFNEQGQVSYLLGTSSVEGDWRFFPVAIAVKTPLTLLAFGLAGIGLLLRHGLRNRDWRHLTPVMLVIGVIAVAIVSRINMGVRHVLPIFAVLAIAGGIALVALWRRASTRPAARFVVAMTAVAGLLSTTRTHPDYLAYFNELAGAHPERILVDSDLDWGQDLKRLADTLRARGIDSVALAYFGSAHPEKYGIAHREIALGDTVRQGHLVVSQTLRQRGRAVFRRRQWTLHPNEFRWLDVEEPAARIGRSLLLYDLK